MVLTEHELTILSLALICEYAQINSYYLVFFLGRVTKDIKHFIFIIYLYVLDREDSVNE